MNNMGNMNVTAIGGESSSSLVPTDINDTKHENKGFLNDIILRRKCYYIN